MAKDKTKAQLETELAASEAARVLAEKRLEKAKDKLREITGYIDNDAARVAREALVSIANTRGPRR